jgi:5-methylcytosine-specific restriction endonuclease McrA
LSDETKEKLRKANLGKKLSIETREKMSKNNGRYWKGKKHTAETNEKNRQAHLGEKSSLWKGGLSINLYGEDWIETLRRSIRERDDYICRMCNKTQIEELEDLERKLAVHHIDYNKNNNDPKNLISLCNNCHRKTNNNREYWIGYFIKGIK